ncbi:MAG TPA: hypothetical protein PLV43_11465 [Aequorivita sp.]|nr:hypothetical protein [Aequorivita sp.]
MDKETAKKATQTMRLIEEAETLRIKMARLSIRDKFLVFHDRAGFQQPEMFPELDEEFKATELEKMIWKDLEKKVFRILTDKIEEVTQQLLDELKKL